MIAVRTASRWASWSGWWGMRGDVQPADVAYWVRTVGNLYPSDGVGIIIRAT